MQQYRQPESEREFLDLAAQRFHEAERAEAEWRDKSLEDWQFFNGEQWPEVSKDKRRQSGEPRLTMNRMPALVKSIVNEQRQARPGITVSPVGDGADVDTAEIFEGIIRHIENTSDSELAADWAHECATIGGRGWFMLKTEYVSDRSFDQELAVRWIRNPFDVYDDPFARQPGGVDASYRFRVYDLAPREYERLFPDTQLATLSSYRGIGDSFAGWANEQTIRVAEYWHVEREESEIYLLDNGLVTTTAPAEKARIAKRRTIEQPKVYYSRINAVEVIEPRNGNGNNQWGKLWPGKLIPIFRVEGDDYDVDRERTVKGVVRDSKDPQKMYNYWASAATLKIALGQRAPFLVAAGQIEDFETEWQTLNTVNRPYLKYKPTEASGQQVPPPQRMEIEPAIQGMVEMLRQADYDMQAIPARFSPAMGKPSSQASSGRAIEALQQKSETASYSFADNLARTKRVMAGEMIEVIPRIYDAPRVQRIVNPDQSTRHAAVYNSQATGISPEAALQQCQGECPEALDKIYDLGVGRYDVTVTIGPSHQTKRQEAVATQVALMQTLPAQAAIIAPYAVRNMDIPQSKEIADAITKTLPPQFQGGEQGTPEQQVASLQQQLQQFSQQHQLLTQVVSEQSDTIRNKRIEQQTQLLKQRMDDDTKILVASIQAKTKSQEQALAEFQAAHEYADDLARLATMPFGGQPQVGQPQASQAQPQPQPQNGQPAGSTTNG